MNRNVLPVVLGAAAIVVGGMAISFGGSRLIENATASIEIPIEPVDVGELVAVEAQEETAPAADIELAQAPEAQPEAATPPASSAKPPAVILDAPQPAPDETYERIEARPPLSELYAPADPAKKPETPKPAPGQDHWKTTRLFNPVASAAGRLEVGRHKVALSGVEPVPPDETCTWNGAEWPCGAAARTAFRLWLRARAVQCKVPDVPQPGEIVTECAIGKADLSDWLINNGWARAADDGPFAEAQDKAQKANLGIFGPPPRRISTTLNPPAVGGEGLPGEADPLESTPDELSQEPDPGFVAPAPAEPTGDFPPPPAAPAQ